MTNCWFCGTEMICGGDFSFKDYEIDGEGIIVNLSCPSCGASAEFMTKTEEN